MTSEVLLMNLEAVALGADSAVTLWSRNRGMVSQTGIDKIFVINEAGPVAAMIYGNGSYAGLPWKTVLGEFGIGCGRATLTINEYRKRLVTFLASLDQLPTLPNDTRDELETFRVYVVTFLIDYMGWLEFADAPEEGPIDEAVATEALELYREAIIIETPAHTDETGQDVPATLRPRIEQTGARLSAFLAEHIGPLFEELFAPVLKENAFPESQVKPLMELCVESIAIEWLPDAADDDTAGLVISGFGAGEAVPSAVSLDILGAFGGILKYRVLDTFAPNPNKRPVVVETFAQANLTHAFLHGAMPAFQKNTVTLASAFLNTIFNQVHRRVGHSNKKLAQELRDFLRPVRQFVPEMAIEGAKDLRRRRVHSQIDPLLGSANASVLGAFAEKFMNLPVTESELLRNDTVARPVHVLTMARGSYTRFTDGVKQ